MAFADLLAIILYLVLCVGLGLYLGGKPGTTKDYFTSKTQLPWWAVSFSIVATETSVLTVISTPTIAYLGNLTFLQLVFGYIIGRTFVAFYILPSYIHAESVTAYTFLGNRFGQSFKKLVSGTFLITRLLADGVRLFAAAIPIKILTGLGYTESILIIAVLTLAYTWYGGIKSVIWIDVLQMGVYIVGGLATLWVISSALPEWAIPSEKWRIFDVSFQPELILRSSYSAITAITGGAFLAMASHGTDHLIVQRLLTCKDLASSRKALISSGFFVLIQFALFLGIGLALFAFFQGASLATLGFQKPDELFPHFILNHLPPGLSGLMIAGLFAAAMSTLSSSLSALSSSTLFDLFPALSENEHSLRWSRGFMVLWTIVFVLFGLQFSSTNHPIIELGLSIAGFTYGALLGAFLLGRFTTNGTTEVRIGFIACVLGMVLLIRFTPLAWPWFTVTGVLIFWIFTVLSRSIIRFASAS